MQIDDTVLAKLETLSHLKIDENKKEAIKEHLSGILAYIDNINALDTDTFSASFSTLDGGTPLRDDIHREKHHVAKDILRHAPQAKDDFFIVPAILD